MKDFYPKNTVVSLLCAIYQCHVRQLSVVCYLPMSHETIVCWVLFTNITWDNCLLCAIYQCHMRQLSVVCYLPMSHETIVCCVLFTNVMWDNCLLFTNVTWYNCLLCAIYQCHVRQLSFVCYLPMSRETIVCCMLKVT